VRFSWQDVKKQVRRRENELAVTLHFLRPGELRAEITRLVAYHEERCGQTRGSFAQDEASALVGDYRLANCLLAVLSAWYAWQQPAWEDVLRTLSAEARAALDEAALRSPVALRLALFDYVNASHSGFLDTQTRSAALEAFAALYHLDIAQLTYLLALDTDGEAVLTRPSLALPEAEAVAALYNQWVFEAALCNSSEVRFAIDCEAFLDAQRTETTGALTGVGAVIKRLCYLARKLGVYYDLTYENTLPGTRTTLLHLTLYGPQEMTGSPQQYGQRLARLCRLLLGYGVASTPYAGPKRQASASLSRAIRQAGATVYVFQKTCRFSMDAALLALLPASEQEREPARVTESTTIYDSSIEQSFAEAFASLERGQGTDGWQLEREPEPLLFATEPGDASARGIFIPDFALTRGTRRIYIEILGFWTPAYRERKIQKLQQLKGRTDLVLAIPVEARQVFSGLAADYPLVEYRGQLSATDLLRMVQERYDDFAERLTGLDVKSIRASVRAAGFVPERACYTLLNCYRRSELARAAAHVLVADVSAYTPGLGLYLHTWLEHLRRSFVEWVEAKGEYELSLSIILQESRVRWPELAACEDAAIEMLVSFWPEVQIRRSSIFEATLIVEALRGEAAEEPGSSTLAETAAPKVARERRASSKKRAHPETSQQNLWE
jgi:predicted nuclease of restriction endonuclease-like RecB superfamily